MNRIWTGPRAVVLMGVSGSGKTTVGCMLAEATHGRFYDADDFHSAANVTKMAAGIPLTDEDRAGWLESLGELLARECDAAHAGPVILACSALKEKYRDILRTGAPDACFIFLQGSPELIHNRLQLRTTHFMPATLLESQFAALEVPQGAIVIDVSHPPDIIVARILRVLAAVD